ncbi:hypothetical protein F5888DRAFT_1615945, partial [Russula emetica]
AHICQHYEIYKEHCKDANIPENHHVIPRQLYRQMKVDKKVSGGVQLTLDGALEKPSKVKVYMHDGATHAIAQFVACDDQVCVMVVRRVDAEIG